MLPINVEDPVITDQNKGLQCGSNSSLLGPEDTSLLTDNYAQEMHTQKCSMAPGVIPRDAQGPLGTRDHQTRGSLIQDIYFNSFSFLLGLNILFVSELQFIQVNQCSKPKATAK